MLDVNTTLYRLEEWQLVQPPFLPQKISRVKDNFKTPLLPFPGNHSVFHCPQELTDIPLHQFPKRSEKTMDVSHL